MQKDKRKGQPFIIILTAVALLVALSFVPWSSLTGGALKDFSLFSDLFPNKEQPAVATANEVIDPELIEAMKHPNEEDVEKTDTVPGQTHRSEGAASGQRRAAETAPPARDIVAKPSRIDGEMVMEDYSADGNGLAHIRSALLATSVRPARIAVIGDSYIEGDIFTQDVRGMLQDAYGGNGVGYMAAKSIVQGFRNTVTHNNSGWTEHGIRDKNCRYLQLPGEYHVGQNGATITYKGKNRNHLSQWCVTRFVFIAPSDGTITLATDAGTQTFDIAASEDVQEIRIDGTTTSLEISSTVPQLVHLGTWLEDTNGVVVDNMSVRGYSGITHRSLDVELSQQLRRYTDYDLIVVEYGINALSSQQSDYTAYSNMMAAVGRRLKAAYPNSDIIFMGVGDRGQKLNGEVHSLPTAPNMVEAQRRAAINAGVVFWDTREAMGGEDAVVEWREGGYINPDYIHLNSKGGQRLARLFVNSLQLSINE